MVARRLPDAWWLPRWLRHTPGGMVWIKGTKLIELQRDALKVADLEAQIRREREQVARCVAERLLCERLANLVDPDAITARALAEVPLTSDGGLHEAAFVALVDALRWETELATAPMSTTD